MDGKKLVTVRISEETEQIIQRMVDTINSGFTGGHINRSELVTWILAQFERQYLTDCMEQLRRDHFDPVIYLEGMVQQVKAAKAKGGVIPDLQKLLTSIGTQAAKPQRSKRSIEKVPPGMDKKDPDPSKPSVVKPQPLNSQAGQTGNQGQN
jgi:hypothetical protein